MFPSWVVAMTASGDSSNNSLSKSNFIRRSLETGDGITYGRAVGSPGSTVHKQAARPSSETDNRPKKCCFASRAERGPRFQQRPLQTQLRGHFAQILKVHWLHDVRLRVETGPGPRNEPAAGGGGGHRGSSGV